MNPATNDVSNVLEAAPLFANAPGALGATGNTGNGEFLPAALETEIRRIYGRSPLYGRRFALGGEPLSWAWYRDVPALSKQEIVERGHEAFFEDYRVIERGLQEKKFEYESTSGTTAGPMTVIMEDGWWNEQTRRAYRAHPLLAPFADAPHRKCVLAPVGCSSNLCPYEDHPFPNRYFDGTVYLNLSSDPFVFPEAEWDRIVTELQAVKPDIIEGEPIYLSLLARAVKKRQVSVPSVKVVILTYGKASLQHSRRVAEAFPAPQVDLYGSTEAGYIFVGTAFKDDSRVIDENAFVELAPYRGTPDVFQIYVTTRGREAMPLLRYHTGDIVRRCAQGYRLLGREGGLYFRESDGAIISPTEIDAAIPADFECWHYSLVQTGDARWDFHYVADGHAPKDLDTALAAALGGGARVNLFRRRTITPAASGKFALLKPLAR
ncbi:phenylacetate-CoA ligase [Ereboglobus sp. PH5-5]|uniref:CoF synthetase n=1 Tax=Ereboglobus sp. PH5-5 TaxID=2940529 RepID=UPI002405A4D9|nr:CoF synthetase [Ereboglobus sp. PH5-5]MDF9832297.1 phenylacetate-CoA ligase [Ereboglobus sp. PH5-5]